MKVLSILSQRMVSISKPSAVGSKKPVLSALKETKKPIIANLKSYYSSAEEKLKDIYLDKIKNKKLTTHVEHNIYEYEHLPDAVKKCIRPSDVSRDGRIDQDKINQLWDAAKKANKPGVYGRAPVFRGEELPEATGLEATGLEATGLAEATDLTTVPELGIDITGSEVDILTGDILETTSNIGESELTEIVEKILDIDEDKANLLSDVIDILS